MTWFKVPDTFDDDPRMFDAPDCAVSLWTRAGVWCSRNLTDGRVPAGLPARKCDDPERAVAELVRRGVWEATDDGWGFVAWTDDQPSRASVLAERAYNARKAALYRDKDLLAAVRARDGSRCRYCGTLVNWKDRRSGTGATYDHVDPKGPNSLDNVVVACRSCNSVKGDRPAHEVGLVLLRAGAMGASDVGSGSDLDTDQDRSRSVQVPDPTRPDPGPPPTSGDPGEGGEQPAAAAPPAPATHVPTSSPEVRAAARHAAALKPTRRRSRHAAPGDRPLVASVARSAPGDPARAEQDRLAELDAVQAADAAPTERVPPSSDACRPPADLREQETA